MPKIRLLAMWSAIFAVIFCGPSRAADYKYAIAQFDSGSGAKMVVIMGYKAADCRKLIETYHSNMKLDCPTCRIDFQSCTNDISDYKAVWSNQKYFAPYYSMGTHRYIFSGMSRAEAEARCEAAALQARTAGTTAICIK
ncbi:MAG: hypothetical protein AABY95_00880 [Pseudomonadota bacterium]|mgnify:CR=1 FL=1